ncbi:uncharacterized protein LOC142232979 [Haematobia irritans]|uniref:uncharacterized protein LOC142232979 n=1 Tax=Haematobia irritans TaxID=7368 RepID=UPI003F4FC7B7
MEELKKEFIFHSDHLVVFCSSFEDIPTDYTDSSLEVLKQDLRERWTAVQQFYKRVFLMPDTEIGKEFKESALEKYGNCTKSFHRLMTRILDFQKTLVAPPDLGKTFMPFENTDTSFSSIKVPPCDTEDFHGGYEEWPSFRDMFTAVYINHPKLSPVQKLYHLRLKVKGQAATIVRKYTLCGDNFPLAWEALRSRYENKRILVDNQLRILLNLKNIQSESSESLQKIQTTINDCLAALKAQGISISDWDPILVYLCSTKLPHGTLSLWEQSLKSHKDLPRWSEMDQFLSDRYEVVERLDSIHGSRAVTRKSPEVNSFNTESLSQITCKLCNKDHALKNCRQFKNLTPADRSQFVSENKMCLNCLSDKHLRKECRSKIACSHCKRNHHTLLHFPNARPRDNSGTNISNYQATTTPESPTPSQAPFEETSPSLAQTDFVNINQARTHFSSQGIEDCGGTLLPTALVTIRHRGDLFKARAFLDQGSEKTFISRSLQQKLMLPIGKKRFEIRGLGGQIVANSNSMCSVSLFSDICHKLVNLKAIVVPKIARLLPGFFIPKPAISTDFDDLDLADPDFHSPGHVDLLLGSDVIPDLLLEGVKHVCGSLIAQSTIFGWIISGPIPVREVTSLSIQTTEISNDMLSQQLRTFWEQEEFPQETFPTPDEEYCETLFSTTTFRNSEGRFVVRLPFKKDYRTHSPLGPSRAQALCQYVRMEKSTSRSPEVAQAYSNVLHEYLTLGHMSDTASQEIFSNGSFHSFYLPHHAVIRPDRLSTKIRVVFNASKQTGSGISLNDILYVGPTLQLDLTSIILRWRLYRYVFCGDIEKMYRQILVHPNDVQYQRILFRPSPGQQIKDYTLNTVTFGINCAPYLAIRTLIQLARDSQVTYPLASKAILNETYVDDILSGAHDTSTAKEALSQLISMLNSAGFPLKKIVSNCTEVLCSVPKENLLDTNFLKFYETSGTKTLGIQWNAMCDEFIYNLELCPKPGPITKRQILSMVSKLFDPVGWVSPIIIQAKILLQQLWIEGTQWDEPVKPTTLQKWLDFLDSMKRISLIKIPRWVNFAPFYASQVHGFCDASEKAYCAVVYIRVSSGESTYSHILISKTKVAPIDPVSLPRLELCGAVLLSRLVKHVLSNLCLEHTELFLWSDSSITLAWLGKPPNTWKTYVANRVAKVIRNVGNSTWRHVRSADNPADIGSRGCSSEELAGNSLWWHGPVWLTSPPEEWPKPTVSFENAPEVRRVETFHSYEKDDILKRFSRWDRAIRVLSYVFRFFQITRKMATFKSISITHNEFTSVKERIIVLTQQEYFNQEYQLLKSKKPVPKKSTLFPLNPFLDLKGIMRVSGRLTNANLRYNESHPIIIPVQSSYAQLLIEFTHILLLHAENNLLLRSLREEYYISRLRSAIKKCIRRCKTCIIYKHKIQSQLMAALPSERSTFSPPFTITGLDFAGPFSIKASTLRNSVYQKSYVCVFVCFSTKAIHLELCSDLSSGSFLAALTRFVSRRGFPKKIMSDNGTNFIGAERKLRQEFQQFVNSTSEEVSKKYLSHGINWCFIPPNAPHIGGLWEAGVKSFKTHFKKIAQNYKYTFEEFTTLLTRIEAVLNSRPLSPVTDDPLELNALTPGHFLRGSSLVAAPEISSDTLSLADRWEKVKTLQHHFARRWKDEYLKELQHRYKWQTPKDNLEMHQLVVIRDDQLPPCEWRLGRICKAYRGSDGYVRVADIKTSSGIVTRDITKAPRNPEVHQCRMCYRFHALRFCRKFLELDIGSRKREVRRMGYCINCLARSHRSYDCDSEVACKRCGGEHHTLLHLPPTERFTLEQMERGRVPSDVSHLIARPTNNERRGTRGGRRSSVQQGSRRTQTVSRPPKETPIILVAPTTEARLATNARRTVARPSTPNARNRTLSVHRPRVERQRKMVRIALNILEKLRDVLDE